MKWIDGTEISISQMTREMLCEKLALELFDYPAESWLVLPDFMQTAAFLTAFDTEITMEGIFGFLENSTGHYAPEIIQAFRAVGDIQDAKILAEICQLAPPDRMRTEFLNQNIPQYEILSGISAELSDEITEQISQLENQLYLNTDFNIWELLYSYLDTQIKQYRKETL